MKYANNMQHVHLSICYYTRVHAARTTAYLKGKLTERLRKFKVYSCRSYKYGRVPAVAYISPRFNRFHHSGNNYIFNGFKKALFLDKRCAGGS